jgi:predicted O-methyltransferase YrrM
MALPPVHAPTGGRRGDIVHSHLPAGMLTLLLPPVVVVPLGVVEPHLYPWLRPNIAAKLANGQDSHRFMSFYGKLRQLLGSLPRGARSLADIAQGAAAQADALPALVCRLEGGTAPLAPGHTATAFQRPPAAMLADQQAPASFRDAMQRLPLLIDEQTYNASHPDYDATKVRNYPGRIFNGGYPSDNLVYGELLKMSQGGAVRDESWTPVLEDVLAEVKTIPQAAQVFERRVFIEKHLRELDGLYRAHYQPGWVNLEDALFLYWLVRRLKPETIVQTGVCNGLSSAFMVLALVKNGGDGRLRAIDLPAVFDPRDPSWTIKDKVYGVVVPEGKSPGWMVPDAYRDRMMVKGGDAKLLLPKLIDELPGVDIFYHDSDHTYNHMTFEFREAKRKLRAGGLIVADDIAWNASVWDFADTYRVPSYNFKGSMGVAFF